MSEIKMIQDNRCTVSRERTVNLGRFGQDYESEKIFISVQSLATPTYIADLLCQTERILGEEVNKIEERHHATSTKKTKR